MSLSDIGMVASSRRVVSLTARFQKGGASISASRHPTRKPSAPNISHSIIETSAPGFGAKRHQPPPCGQDSSGKVAPVRHRQLKKASARLPERQTSTDYRWAAGFVATSHD